MLTELSALPEIVHISLALILGLLVGSFLNVVIYRYPKLLKYQWSAQSYEWLNQKPFSESAPPGIISPGSRCGHCQVAVKAWQNIPLLSYLLLGGKCANCKTSIGLRYPLVELLTGLLSAYIVYHFGWSIQAIFSLLLTWVLVALTFIDLDHQLLPDDLVLPTLWLGLGLSLVPIYAAKPEDAIIGALVGYLSLWSVMHLFKLLTGKQGMGHGDFKLLAVFGAWLGWQYLPQIILISTLLGSFVGLILIVTKNINRDNAIPFGPYIALAGWIALLWGKQINQFYLQATGL